LEKVLDFYENQLKSQGMEVTREVSGGVGMKTGSLTATDSANGRTVHVNYLPAAGGNKVHVHITLEVTSSHSALEDHALISLSTMFLSAYAHRRAGFCAEL
jgi:hypothetical protein